MWLENLILMPSNRTRTLEQVPSLATANPIILPIHTELKTNAGDDESGGTSCDIRMHHVNHMRAEVSGTERIAFIEPSNHVIKQRRYHVHAH